jgi:DNA-directed RNA polymerase specialized sigma54-like protein
MMNGYLRDDFIDIQKDLLEKREIVVDVEEFESVLIIIQKFEPCRDCIQEPPGMSYYST